MLLFAFNGLVFVLLGIQLRSVLTRLEGDSWLQLAGYAIALVFALIVVRIAWVFPAAYLPRYFSQKIRASEPPLDPRAVFIVGWAGIRGSVTMAAALSIPFALESGAPFPGRDLVIFLAGTTIVLTLLLNAITLPLLIRLFHIRGDGNAEREERAARIATSQAAIDLIQRELPNLTHPKEIGEAQRLLELYQRRLDFHSANADRRRQIEAVQSGKRRLALAALEAERTELFSLRDTDVINEETLRTIQSDLDHAESLVAPNARQIN
jgi:hypothetical protein